MMVNNFKFKVGVMLWLLIMLVFMGTGGNCDKVEFYGKENYEGYIDEYDLSGEKGGQCRNFLFSSLDIKSLKTDRCIMLFGSVGCDIRRGAFPFPFPTTDPSYSLRVDADTTEITGTLNAGGTQIVHSFGPCSRERGGGPEVDVDFYGEVQYRGEPTASYRDVCGCQNVRKSAVGGKSKKISVDNHGHDIDFFEGEHCTGQKRSVRAGSNWATKWMWDPRDEMAYFDVQSFRPTHTDGCIKLSASIDKFMFEEGSQTMIDHATEENVKLATDSTLRNNGAQSIVQEYSVSGKVTEVVEVTRTTGYSNMETVKVEGSVQVEAAVGVPLIAEGKVTAKLTNSFQYQRTDSGSTSNKTSITNEEVVTVRQQITIQPCRECIASSFVKKVKNFPIKYTAYSRVSGTAGAGGARMSAHDVRSALRPEVKYLGDHDAYTVNTMVEGVMYAEYGINSFINVDCNKIADCVATPPKPGIKNQPSHMTFTTPLRKSGLQFYGKKNYEGTEGVSNLVQFFEKPNYQGFLKQFDLSGDEAKRCQGLDPELNVKSLKTNRCIMLFGDPACNMLVQIMPEWKLLFSYSLRFDTDTPLIDQTISEGANSQIARSFAYCSREMGGGPEVDVAFYSQSDYRGERTAVYLDVCGCQNVDKAAVGGKSRRISVENTGHSLDFFEGEHCTGQMRTVRAGVNWANRWMWDSGDQMPYFDVHSFRPTNYQDCIKLDANIYKFVFEKGTEEMIKNSTEQNVKLATDSILRNNGAQSIVQEYSVSGKISKTVDITTSTGFSNMHTAKADVTVSTEVKAGFEFLAEGKVRTQIALGYQYTRTDTGSTTNRTSVVDEETITVRQQITIQPCRECIASTFVKKVKNFPIKYTAYSKVTGMAGGTRLSAQEVRSSLRPEVIYLGEIDAYTVDTKVEGVMFAEYGLNSFINVDCKKIADCVAAPPKPDGTDEPSHNTYVHPINRGPHKSG